MAEQGKGWEVREEEGEDGRTVITVTPEGVEPDNPTIIRRIEPSAPVLEALLKTLLWQLDGLRGTTQQSRYLYLKDALYVQDKLDFTFEEFRSDANHNEGALVDGIMITMRRKPGVAAEDLPETYEEEATEGGYDAEEALEAIAPYLGDLTDGEAKEVAKILGRLVR